MIFEERKEGRPDLDPAETREWLESLDAVAGRDRSRAAQRGLPRALPALPRRARAR
jgi:pyruvate dehydrogenase complex dehydrogenase (E1) component